MTTYLRVTDGKTVIWVIQRKTGANEHYRVFEGDEVVFNELALPKARHTPIYALTSAELFVSKHFECAAEQNVMLNAFADMITMAPGTDGPFAACSAANFERCVRYCSGKEIDYED